MKYIAFLTACLCTPAFAASTVEIDCDEAAGPSIHEVAVSEITASETGHELEVAPRIEMLSTEALDEQSTTAVDDADDPVAEIVIRDALDRRLPIHLPGNDSALYKRKMYRTDI